MILFKSIFYYICIKSLDIQTAIYWSIDTLLELWQTVYDKNDRGTTATLLNTNGTWLQQLTLLNTERKERLNSRRLPKKISWTVQEVKGDIGVALK